MPTIEDVTVATVEEAERHLPIPYSEVWFTSLKLAPVFPEHFGKLGEARLFMSRFVDGYNHTHHHTGIGLNMPADGHYGLAAGRAIERSKVLAAARAQNPERFSTRTDSKILALPGPAWISEPAEAPALEEAPRLAA